jgi:hypothetical protein
MAPTIHPAATLELAEDEAATFAYAVVEREPDHDVADGDLAWWLRRQERAEIRAALAAAGLL